MRRNDFFGFDREERCDDRPLLSGTGNSYEEAGSRGGSPRSSHIIVRCCVFV